MKIIQEWLINKWRLLFNPNDVQQAYLATFTSVGGRVVLQHLLDNVYCQVYEGTDPNACMIHNARRSVIHEILTTIDAAQNPAKYSLRLMQEMENVNGA